ncbi:DUF6059 family protein [Streptomyces sp. NPDC087866]|uniref:DUF6059 family protein n=1 Tax=unclassified Streptomyces TaxID=2593676 RepID=UPI0022528DF9|nr:DUF6059 family protein [Streptomyces sp. NBC_01789]MCX4450551.1 hypothetical protein [Streptomyces sp. NBC_01789]
MRLVLARYLRSFASSLIAFGRIWVYIPPTDEQVGKPAEGPPPGHPERLCPEIPLSAAERAWGRQLLGMPGAEP